MNKVTTILFAFILLLGLVACGGNDKEAKKDEEKKDNKQTVQKADNQTEKRQEKFNHSAAMKVTQIVAQVPGVIDPLVVVYDKDGIMAYKLEGDGKAAEIERKIKQKLKAYMPDYQIHVNGDPEWYNRVAVLHQDTIDSEGRLVKDLRGTFNELRDSSKK